MKHSGIYLYTDSSDPNGHLWMFHWSSATLARLDPGGDRPTLFVSAAASPPDAAIVAFGGVIDDMVPGMSENLLMHSSAEPNDAPEFLFMAPASPETRGFIAVAPKLGLAIGSIAGTGIIGPLWKAEPDQGVRDEAIRRLSEWAKQEVVRTADKSFQLELFQQSTYFPALWLQRPDLTARVARPLPASS